MYIYIHLKLCDSFGMLAKTTNIVENQGVSYARLETALAQVFKVDVESQRGWFRARIQHLRRLNFFPHGPGRGKVVQYDFMEAARLLFALELEAAGADPKAVVQFLSESWVGVPSPGESLSDLVRKAVDPRKEDLFIITWINVFDQDAPIGTGHGYPRQFPALLSNLSQDDKALRVGLFNLSSRLRALRTALSRQ
jgi:hypothetical protein